MQLQWTFLSVCQWLHGHHIYPFHFLVLDLACVNRALGNGMNKCLQTRGPTLTITAPKTFLFGCFSSATHDPGTSQWDAPPQFTRQLVVSVIYFNLYFFKVVVAMEMEATIVVFVKVVDKEQ